MTLDNIYKNTITFPSNGNIELTFKDNKSETRYLLDIIIDGNIMINNVFSIGTYKNIGTIINNSAGDIGISLDSVKVTLVLVGSHSVGVKIKQGIFLEMKNNVVTPTHNVISVGYSFGLGNLIMTETQNNYYKNTLFAPFNTTALWDINSLLDTNEEVSELYTPYSHDNVTYPKFAYTDKLISNSIAETSKNKHISSLIEDASIDNELFVDSNLKKEKLAPTVKDSINLADTALQNVFINKKVTPEIKTDRTINLNLSDHLSIIKKNDVDYYNYPVEDNGTGTIEYTNIDLQSKIINPHEDLKSYFVSYLTNGEYGFEDMDLFFKKQNNIKLEDSTTSTNDLLYSSSKLSSLLNNKVDKIVPTAVVVVDKLINMKVNAQGQVVENSLVSLSDLSGLLDTYYQKTGVKQAINTARSTIFFM